MLVYPMIDLINTMIGLKDTLLREGADFTAIAVVFAAMGAMAATVKTFASIMNGQNFSIWQIVKPLCVCILCCHFNLVVDVLDIVPNTMAVGMSRLVGDLPQKNYTAYQKIQQRGKEKQDEEIRRKEAQFGITMNDPSEIDSNIGEASATSIIAQTESTSGEEMSKLSETPAPQEDNMKWFARIGNSIKNAYLSVFGFMLDNLAGQMSRIFTWLMKILVPVMAGASQIFCGILALLGPFALALSLFPGLGGFGMWVSKYLHTAFWLPVTYMVDFVYQTGLYELSGGWESANTLKDITTSMGGAAMLAIVCLFCCLKVPSIAGHIVQSAGMGAGELGNKVLNKGKQVVMSLAGGPAGAAASAAGKVGGVVK